MPSDIGQISLKLLKIHKMNKNYNTKFGFMF